MMSNFYRAFEERYYASRDAIKKIRRNYFDFVRPLSVLYPGAATFDARCGRGEWLELMSELGFTPYGVDLDDGMLSGCVQLGLSAHKDDAVNHIQTLPDNSQALVTAFHVVEHIPFERVQTLIQEALRVLKPGGLLILETPNPENIFVATQNFYFDPTHLKPIPSQLLAFTAEYAGYARVEVVRLHESEAITGNSEITLLDVTHGVSFDYAIVAQKYACDEVLELFQNVYATKNCSSQEKVIQRWDAQFKAHISMLQAGMQQAENKVQVYENSFSWRLTKPLRRLNPKRAFARFLRLPVKFVLAHPAFAYKIKPIVKRHQGFWGWLIKHALFDQDTTNENDRYLTLTIGEMNIQFAKGALNDSRGIGRVTSEFLSHLQTAANKYNTSTDPTEQREVFFYTSVHWCPKKLAHPSVVMVHDVIPLLFPELFPKPAVSDWENRLKSIAQQADKIVTISASSAQDIAKQLDIPLDKISVIHNGVTLLPANMSANILLPDAPFLVYIGSGDYHKNIGVIFQALSNPEVNDIHLLMIGDNKNCLTTVIKLGLRDRVHFLGRLEDAQMGWIISRALALVFPSKYEGFGLPPLEAALLGVPSICSRRPAMTELLEDAALFAEPNSPMQWAEAIARIRNEPELRKELSNIAKHRVQQYTWEDASSKLIGILKEEAK